jgi:hypothetical protein
MRLSTRLGVALLLAGLLSGCLTTQDLVTKVKAVFYNLSVGAYRATPQQIRLADQRATAAYKRFSPQEKKTFKESGKRYLAVRTADPTPAQRAEIRRDMEKPGSKYFGQAKTGKIYCVMIWDTQSKEVVGTDCYAVASLPTSGTVARFDTYTAQYVGSL